MRSLGEISFTKFTSPEATVEVLSEIEPGQTTGAKVEAALAAKGQPSPLWNDLLAYDPPLANARTAAGSQVAVDNELLRAARDGRPDRYLLLWVALILADSRLDEIVRDVLADSNGHLKPAEINGPRLRAVLDARAEQSDEGLPNGPKATSNVLSLLERCRLIEPVKHGGTIVGIDHTLPTRHAVRGTVVLVRERLADQGFRAVEGRELELALSVGANAWLNLSAEEFRAAYNEIDTTKRSQSSREAVPDDLVVLAAQLRRKGQVVLQGPPGSGKTHVAKQYITWATANRTDESRLQSLIDDLPANERNVVGIASEVQRRGLVGLWDIVQFHPGYDYTDFVRALVAKPHGEGVTFVPEHRILSLISAVGLELKDRGYDIELALILDELNRGDIPNIFGELLYGLEYRDHAIATPYAVDGSGSLTIPSNLRVLGTMNTADRSIAVIDYALRRRFVFLDVASTSAPIHGFAFDEPMTKSAALHLYGATAEALGEAPSGLQVGPSYFMAESDGTDSSLNVLAARYVYEVLPLLAEYEMEGEIDPDTVAGLRQSLGLSENATQLDNAAQLLTYLRSEPWIASQDGEAAGSPDVGKP